MNNLENFLPVLLANFIVQVLPLLMLVAAILLLVRARKRGPRSSLKHYVGICLAAFPAGIFAYIFAGIAAARIRKEGHFYSVPFGGFGIGNAPIGFSLFFWIALVFCYPRLRFAPTPLTRGE